MSNKNQWVNDLNINEADFNSWIHDKPKDEASSYWCLKTSKLDPNTYLNWAKNYYKLPVMNTNYKNFKADTSFWTQLEAVANWSESMVPLYFWKTTLFILVTEPLDNNWSFPVNYVLGSPEQLSFFWNKLNTENRTAPQLAVAQNNEKVIEEELPELPTQEKQQAIPIITSKDHKPEVVDDMDSLSLIIENKNSAQTKNNIFSLKDSKKELTLSDQKSAANKLSEASMDNLLTQENNTSNNMKNRNTLDLEGLMNLQSSESQIDGLEGLNSRTEQALPPEDSLLNLEIATAASPSLASNGLEGLQLRTETIRENTLSEMPDLSLTTESLRIEKLNKELSAANNDSQELNIITTETVKHTTNGNGSLSIFNKINSDFQKTLAFELKDDQLFISHQDGSWKFTNDQALPLQKEPCLFKFCLTSKLPFHGAVSDKDSIKYMLFKKLNITNAQTHITLLPLVNSNNQVNRFVLSVGSKENLQALDRLSELSSPVLKEIISSAI